MSVVSRKKSVNQEMLKEASITSCLLPNAGLGNKLFPWARCVVFSRLNSIPMLEPIFFNVKIGPWLRGERDKRLYLNQIRKTPRNIPFPLGLYFRMAARRIDARIQDSARMHRRRYWNNSWVCPRNYVFSGEEEHFKSLLPYHALIKDELLSITSERILANVARQSRQLPKVALHIRRGDFQSAECDEDYKHKGALRTPILWYREILLQIKISNPTLNAYIVSDADDSELSQLLEIPGLQRRATGTALGDLLLLSKARFIIGSGGSSFSAWACFLSQCPVVSVEGQSFSWFSIPHAHNTSATDGFHCFTLPLRNPMGCDSGRKVIHDIILSMSEI